MGNDDYRQIDKIHQEVLKKIENEGAIAGIDFYEQHKNLYDSLRALGNTSTNINVLRKKKEIVCALEKEAGVIGIDYARPEKKVGIEDALDYAISVIKTATETIGKKQRGGLINRGRCPPEY
ncbi:MAG: hypothetical protein PHH54_06915 [Candidatus Nanoarchaeia archaeon]|nr:hypothetical protein [Candidatus Nanoarchaeia archaeon]MDD5741686.1 hypothetical protein [Candidatus Nanoarchaeia archaeon]